MRLTKVCDIFKNAKSFTDKPISIGGWIRTTRRLKNFGFIELNDGSCFKNIQIVYNEKTYLVSESELSVGAAVIIYGELKLTPVNKQPFEIHADKIILEGSSSGDFPVPSEGRQRKDVYLRLRIPTSGKRFSILFRPLHP